MTLRLGTDPTAEEARYVEPRSTRGMARLAAVYGGMVVLPVVLSLWLLRFAKSGHAHSSVKPSGAPRLADPASSLLLACVVIVGVAGVAGIACRVLSQSPVVGEMLSGVLLGPSVLGALFPGIERSLFPPGLLPLLNAIAQLGVVFFMFLVGLELPLGTLRRVGPAVLPIGHAAVAVPFLLGTLLALAVSDCFGPAGVAGVPFSLFVALSVSVTAFPVLARILSDRDLLGTRIGAMGMAVAGVGDVTAWCVLGIVVAEVRNSSQLAAVRSLAAVTGFVVVLWFAVRPVLAWLLGVAGQRWLGSLPAGALIAAYVLGCAELTNAFGVHAIFGAFASGVVTPRSSRAVADFAIRIEGLVGYVLLPVFFVTIGLHTDLRSAFTRQMLGPLLALLAVAVVGKFAGASLSAAMTGEQAAVALGMGAMMNCRGLTELVVLNIGLTLGVIESQMFALLVVMAIVTTMMTDPLLRLFGVGRNSGAVRHRAHPVEAEAVR